MLHLACSGGLVSATAITGAQLADVRAARSVKNGLANREHGILLLISPQDMDRDIAHREQRIHDKPIGCVNGFLVAKIQHNQVVVNARTTRDLLLGALTMLLVHIDAFFDIRRLQNLLDG